MKQSVILFIFFVFCLSCKSPTARKPESIKSSSFLKESAQRNKILYDLEKKQIETLINNKFNKKFITSNNGFWYSYNTQYINDTLQPVFGDIINYDVTISSLNSTTIYPMSNKTYVMEKEELFTGLREGLKLMKPTESVTFIFPSQLAFGYYGDDNKIGTNVPLICNVTLNTIKKER